MSEQTSTAGAAGTIDLGGDLTVNRLGFGAMRITGSGIWGEPPDRDDGQGRAAPRRRAGRELHRHRRLVRPGGERGADRRGAVPVPRRPGHRHQGRPGAARPQPVDRRTAARAPARGAATAACAGCGSSRSRCTSSTGPTRRCRWRTRSARWSSSRTQGKIRHIGVSNVDRGAAARGAAAHPDRVDPEPVQRRRPRLGVAGRPVRAGADRVPAVGADPEPRRTTRSCGDRRSVTASRASRWCSPGCSAARRRSCRSPAPARSRTWRRTWPPRRSPDPGRDRHHHRGDELTLSVSPPAALRVAGVSFSAPSGFSPGSRGRRRRDRRRTAQPRRAGRHGSPRRWPARCR